MLNREEVHSADILLVDDVPGNLDVLFELLQTHRHTVRTAINGALALRTIAAAPPDLILLDVMMPDMDGFEVCRRLKANLDTAGISIIFITARPPIVNSGCFWPKASFGKIFFTGCT